MITLKNIHVKKCLFIFLLFYTFLDKNSSTEKNIILQITDLIQHKKPISSFIFNKLLPQEEIPESFFGMFSNFIIQNPTIHPIKKDTLEGIIINGSILFQENPTKIKIFIAKDINKKTLLSITIDIPKKIKLSMLEQKLSFLNEFSLFNGQFVLSNVNYQHKNNGIVIKKGLNVVTDINLTGPLLKVKNLIDNQKSLQGLVLDASPIKFHGVLSKNITDSFFTINLPLKLGVNFNQLANNNNSKNPMAKKLLQSIENYIQQINSTNFSIAINQLPKATIELKSDIELITTKEKKSIFFHSIGNLLLTGESFSLQGLTTGDLTITDWFTIKNPGLELNWDIPIIVKFASVGIPMPFTGIGITGIFAIDDFLCDVTGGIRTTENDISPIQSGFQGQIKNLSFNNIINFFLKNIVKKDIPVFLPQITLNDCLLTIWPLETTFASKSFKPAMQLKAEAQLFNTKGNIDIYVSCDKNNPFIEAKGKLDPFGLTYQNKKIVNFYGQTINEGPSFNAVLLPNNTEKNNFMMSSAIEIPSLDIKKEITNFSITKQKITGNFATKIQGFLETALNIELFLQEPEKSIINFSCNQEISDLLTKTIAKLLKNLDNKGPSMTNKEDLLAKKLEFNQQCAGIKSMTNALECTKITKDITLLKLKIAQEKIANTTVGKTIKDTLESIATQLLIPSIKSFEIKQCKGSWQPTKIFPTLDILEVSINTPLFKKNIILQDIMFDAHNVKLLIQHIANKIVYQIGDALLP